MALSVNFLILLGAFQTYPVAGAFAATGVIWSARLYAVDVSARYVRPGGQNPKTGGSLDLSSERTGRPRSVR